MEKKDFDYVVNGVVIEENTVDKDKAEDRIDTYRDLVKKAEKRG